MTQPATQPVVETQSAPPGAESVDKFLESITEELGFDPGVLPQGEYFCDIRNNVYERGKPPMKGREDIAIFSMFMEDDTVVRLYCVPVKPGGQFTRYSMLLRIPGVYREVMSYETFKGELIDELKAQSGIDDDEPEEPEEAPTNGAPPGATTT